MATTTNVIKGGLAFQEIGYDPTGTVSWDVDGLGVGAFSDEFIAIVNTSGASINLAGVEVWEDQLVHQFTGGSLGPGEVLYILDDAANLANAQAQNPSLNIVQASGTMGLTNAGDGLGLVDTGTGDYVLLDYEGGGTDPATASTGFPGTNLIGTDSLALDADGQTLQRSPVGDDTFVIANSTLCFGEGTLIATADGETTVEMLNIGDEILTTDGRLVPVLWIGRQTVNKLFAGPRMEPVRIRAGALGNGLPHTDLTVTADHGMIIDGLVVNAGALVNGSTIDWVPMAELPDQVTYYHIETENHDVILANGAPAETFIDYAGRKGFDNYQEYLDLYGGVEPLIPEMPMLRVSSRRQLPAHLCERFGIGNFAEDVTADTLAFLENNRVA